MTQISRITILFKNLNRENLDSKTLIYQKNYIKGSLNQNFKQCIYNSQETLYNLSAL